MLGQPFFSFLFASKHCVRLTLPRLQCARGTRYSILACDEGEALGLVEGFGPDAVRGTGCKVVLWASVENSQDVSTLGVLTEYAILYIFGRFAECSAHLFCAPGDASNSVGETSYF